MNIGKYLVTTLTFVLASMILCGCSLQAQLPKGPVYFTDANNGRTVAPVLVLPNYSWYSKSKEGLSFANPFIYHSDGAPFKVEQPLSTAIIIPFFISTIHRMILFDGVDVYAKGYKVKGVDFRFLIKERPRTFTLEPIDENESKQEFARISDGLYNKNFEVLLAYHLILEDTIVDYDFTKKELKIMKAFFETDVKTE